MPWTLQVHDARSRDVSWTTRMVEHVDTFVATLRCRAEPVGTGSLLVVCLYKNYRHWIKDVEAEDEWPWETLCRFRGAFLIPSNHHASGVRSSILRPGSKSKVRPQRGGRVEKNDPTLEILLGGWTKKHMEGKVTPSSWDVFFNEHDICVAGFFCSFYLDLADFSW